VSTDPPLSNALVPRFDPVLVQARWILGGLSPEELVSQALLALDQDFSGDALQQIAGLAKPTVAELDTLPERAFAELGLKPLDKQGAVDVLMARGGLSENRIVRSLLADFPALSDRWRKYIEEWGGEYIGDYMDMAEVVHFVVEDLHDKGRLDEVRRIFEFMERHIVEGDQETRNLMGFGFFETLQNFASHSPNGYREYEQFLGRTSKQMWREIERAWEGKSSLMDVLQAERRGR
jgi:hypothetical protein